jgi:hypothetical protein
MAYQLFTSSKSKTMAISQKTPISPHLLAKLLALGL